MEPIIRLFPELCLQVKRPAKSMPHEWFSLSCAANHVELIATSPLAEKYALSQLEVGLRSGYLGDLVGPNLALFSLRPIWVERLPSLEALLFAGYNMVITSQEENFAPLRQSGIKVGLYLKNPPANVTHLEGNVDYLVCDEGLQIQTSLPIITLAKRTTDNVQELSHKGKQGSMVAFHAMRDKKLHPVFSELAKATFALQTRLLPLLEVDQLPLSEGELLSDFPLEAIEMVLGRQKGVRFAGAGCVTKSLPAPDALAYCPLWLIGQRMWRHVNVHGLLQMWLEAYHPEWQSLFDPELIHRLFWLKKQQDVEAASSELTQFAKALAEAFEARRFSKTSPSQKALAKLLLLFQNGYKAHLETFCQERMRKIPLQLQNFLAFSFSKK